MRKRVAAKVIYRCQPLTPAETPYKDTTLDQAVDKLWGSLDHWRYRGCRVRTKEGAVRPARPA